MHKFAEFGEFQLNGVMGGRILADAKKANLVIEAVASSEIDRIVGDLFKLEPAIAAKLAEVMK